MTGPKGEEGCTCRKACGASSDNREGSRGTPSRDDAMLPL